MTDKTFEDTLIILGKINLKPLKSNSAIINKLYLIKIMQIPSKNNILSSNVILME